MKGKKANSRRYKKLPQEQLNAFEDLVEWYEKIAAALRDGTLDPEEFKKKYRTDLDEVRDELDGIAYPSRASFLL